MIRDQAALVASAKQGQREALDLLASTVVDRLYAVARLVLRDLDRAEDAVQRRSSRCWRDLPSLRDVAKFDAWPRRLLMRAITDEFRRARSHRASIGMLHLEPSIRDASSDVVIREYEEARGVDFGTEPIAAAIQEFEHKDELSPCP